MRLPFRTSARALKHRFAWGPSEITGKKGASGRVQPRGFSIRFQEEEERAGRVVYRRRRSV
jgi:hypothetical protein